jgi:predicted DNA-binding protein (UPF0278 family)
MTCDRLQQLVRERLCRGLSYDEELIVRIVSEARQPTPITPAIEEAIRRLKARMKPQTRQDWLAVDDSFTDLIAAVEARMLEQEK